MEISERAKRLVAALEHWRTLESAYEIAQGFLDEERAEAADSFSVSLSDAAKFMKNE